MVTDAALSEKVVLPIGSVVLPLTVSGDTYVRYFFGDVQSSLRRECVLNEQSILLSSAGMRQWKPVLELLNH